MTTSPLTPAELPALRALYEKATPGPWRALISGFLRDHPRISDAEDRLICVVGNMEEHRQDFWDADASLIAAARDALPRACATIEAQAKTIAERDAEIARLREALANAQIEIDAAQEFGGGFYGDVVAEGTREFYRIEARARAALAKEPQT